MKIELNKTEVQFLEWLLEEVQNSPLDYPHSHCFTSPIPDERHVVKTFAYLLQRKIGGEYNKKNIGCVDIKTAYQNKNKMIANIKRLISSGKYPCQYEYKTKRD